MHIDRLLAKARVAIAKQHCIDTPALAEYIGAMVNTPMGIGRISKVSFAYTRRINGKAYKLYTLTIDINNKTYRITTYADTQWSIH